MTDCGEALGKGIQYLHHFHRYDNGGMAAIGALYQLNIHSLGEMVRWQDIKRNWKTL